VKISAWMLFTLTFPLASLDQYSFVFDTLRTAFCNKKAFFFSKEDKV